MKKLILPLIISTLIIFGCSKEEFTPLEVADFSIHVGGQTKSTAGNIAIDDYITFVDVSRNAIEHEWKIDEGNSFISDEFTELDSVYTDFIISGAGNTSTEKKVNILFQEAGLQPIQIINKFDKEPINGPATPTQQGGLWVIDTTYMIDVFDNLQPAFKVYKGTEEILSVAAGDLPDANNASSWPIVEVEVGQTLTFVDVTAIGRPNKRAWTSGGGVPATSPDSSATVSYFSLGTYAAGGFASIRDGIRPEQASTKVVPIQVKVIPSSVPFLYEGNMFEQADELITFNVGGEVAPFSGQEGKFTVNVVNDAAGFDQNIDVQLAKVSDSDATKIELRLSAPIYNSDVISVSYSGNEIKSADFRVLSDFGPETVTMHFAGNLITSDYASFEVEHANWKKAFCEGIWIGNSNGAAATPHFARTEELAAIGSASMKLDLFNGVETKLMQGSDIANFGLLAGSYQLSFQIYLEPGNILTTVETVTVEPEETISWDISNLPRGEWVEISQPHTFSADLTKRYDFKVTAENNPMTTDPQVLYIDDFQFKAFEER